MRQSGQTQPDKTAHLRLRNRLSLQSWQIERLFGRHRAEATVRGGAVEQGWTRFDLLGGAGQDWPTLRRIQRDMRRLLGQRDVRVSRRGHLWQIGVGKQTRAELPLLEFQRKTGGLPPATAALGLASHNEPVLLEFAAGSFGHALVTGPEGSGKSDLLRTIVISLALSSRQSDVQMAIIAAGPHDEGSGLLAPLDALPHLMADVAYKAGDIADLLQFLAGEAAYREKLKLAQPAIVIVIDDVEALLLQGAREVRIALMRLLQRGAAFGVHLILSAEHSGSAALGRLFLANITTRLEVVSTARPGSGGGRYANHETPVAESARGERTRTFKLVTEEKSTLFRVLTVDDYDLHLALRNLLAANRPALLALPLANEDDNEVFENAFHGEFSLNAGDVELRPPARAPTSLEPENGAAASVDKATRLTRIG